MTPLSEALTTAQKRALISLEKAYQAGYLDAETFTASLAAFGISDPVDVAFLLSALDVLREWGVSETSMTERVQKQTMITPGQVTYINDLLVKGKHTPLNQDDLATFTFDKASRLISSLKAGSYKPEEWDVPF